MAIMNDVDRNIRSTGTRGKRDETRDSWTFLNSDAVCEGEFGTCPIEQSYKVR